MSTSYENGLKEGAWTPELVKKAGFTSAEACLRHCEQEYEEDRSSLPQLRAKNPEYAERQAEHLEGRIFAARRDLRAMLEKTSYEQGLEQGKWTREQVTAYGFASPAECLAHEEAKYHDHIKNVLPTLNPEQAKNHAEFMEGVIVAARQSLQAMMNTEYTSEEKLRSLLSGLEGN